MICKYLTYLTVHTTSKTLQSFVSPFFTSHLLTKTIFFFLQIASYWIWTATTCVWENIFWTLPVQIPHPTQAKSNSPPLGWPFTSNSRLHGHRKCSNTDERYTKCHRHRSSVVTHNFIENDKMFIRITTFTIVSIYWNCTFTTKKIPCHIPRFPIVLTWPH